MKTEENPQSSIVFIVGPTASGKSALAMDLAKRVGGEVICADSQTIRRHLDIGTAKPTKEEQAEIPHHMIDVIEPYERYSVAQFKKSAEKAILAIQTRGKLPIVVGGTGLYIDALFFNYTISDAVVIDDFEKLTVSELQNLIQERGYDMPENSQNPRHLVGVLRRAGTFHNDRQHPRNGAKIYGLQWPDEILKDRINERIEQMFDTGFLDEVRAIIARYGAPPIKFDAIGYPIAQRYLDGEISIEKAKELFKRGDWQYARRQKAWFKRNPHITWFTPNEAALEHILKDLNVG